MNVEMLSSDLQISRVIHSTDYRGGGRLGDYKYDLYVPHEGPLCALKSADHRVAFTHDAVVRVGRGVLVITQLAPVGWLRNLYGEIQENQPYNFFVQWVTPKSSPPKLYVAGSIPHFLNDLKKRDPDLTAAIRALEERFSDEMHTMRGAMDFHQPAAQKKLPETGDDRGRPSDRRAPPGRAECGL